MIQRIVSVFSFTWLFWLYLSPQLLSISLSSAKSDQAGLPAEVTKSSFVQAISVVQTMASTSLRSQSLINTSARLEIHLRRRELVLYNGDAKIKSYPIAIGQAGWETPTGNFKVMQMLENPIWIHPLTRAVVPSGDDRNPLGPYWVGFWTNGDYWLGFHGTPQPKSVGKASSHGCLRMYNDDISELFYQVSTGTSVSVQP